MWSPADSHQVNSQLTKHLNALSGPGVSLLLDTLCNKVVHFRRHEASLSPTPIRVSPQDDPRRNLVFASPQTQASPAPALNSEKNPSPVAPRQSLLTDFFKKT